MKKLLTVLFTTLLLLGTAYAAERCPDIWNKVSGQTYIMTVDGQGYEIAFAASTAGPCPQAQVIVSHDGATLLECKYATEDDNLISIDCGGGEVYFLLMGDRLLPIDLNAPVMVRQGND